MVSNYIFRSSGVKHAMSGRKNSLFRSLFLAVVFSAVVVCDDSFGLRLTTDSFKTKENTQYTFHYFVKDDKTGDYKTQKETKEGDSVHGSYTLAEPNGDLRTVTYKAGPGRGFEAKVDVQSSGSPMKPPTERMTVSSGVTNSASGTTNSIKTEKPTTLKSNVNHFPGGFEMGVSSNPLSDVKTEMGMKFSLKTSPVTEPIKAVVENKPTEKSKVTQTTHSGLATDNLESSTIENSTFPTEGREIGEDAIEREIDEAINSMPKLPELVLSDNKTHFKFHKDPEEALLDERITQIARQLAETSLRREYEERKLGHFIPISVSSVGSTDYLSKSFKFYDPPNTKPSPPSTLNVLTHLRVVPQYVYRQTLIPSITHSRLPIAGRPTTQKPEQWEQKTYESITNPPDILKVNKIFKMKEKKLGPHYKPTDREPTPVVPVHVPTILQFFTPYVMHSSGQKSDATTVKKDLGGKGVTLTNYDTTRHTPVATVADNGPLKS